MRKWVLANQKGGVGKTTLGLNLAVCAEEAELLTSVIDLDPQESAFAWYKRRGRSSPSWSRPSPTSLRKPSTQQNG